MKQVYLAAAIALAIALLGAAPGECMQTIFGETTLSVDGGLSLPTGSAADMVNIGFCAGFNAFYYYNDFLLIGARLAYNRWGADEEVWETIGYAADVEGHYSGLEIVPQVRYLIMPDETRLMNFFAQAGLGFYRIAYDVEVTYKGGPIASISTSDKNLDLGLCIGGGMRIEIGRLTYEFNPMYHIVFTEGDEFTYFTVTGGVAF